MTCLFRSRLPAEERQSEAETSEGRLILPKHVVQTYTDYSTGTNKTRLNSFPASAVDSIMEKSDLDYLAVCVCVCATGGTLMVKFRARCKVGTKRAPSRLGAT